MSAHCNDCGADLVHVPGDWPKMECPVCSVQAKFDRLLQAAKQWRDAPKRVTSEQEFREQTEARDNLVAAIEGLEGE